MSPWVPGLAGRGADAERCGFWRPAPQCPDVHICRQQGVCLRSFKTARPGQGDETPPPMPPPRGAGSGKATAEVARTSSTADADTMTTIQSTR